MNYTSLKEALLSRVKNATDINNIQTSIKKSFNTYLQENGILDKIVKFNNIATNYSPGAHIPKGSNTVSYSEEEDAIVLECKLLNDNGSKTLFNRSVRVCVYADMFEQYNIPKKIIITGNSKKLKSNNIKIGRPVILEIFKSKEFNNNNGTNIEGFEFITGYEYAKGLDSVPNVVLTTPVSTKSSDIRGFNRFINCKFSGNFSFYTIGSGTIKGYSSIDSCWDYGWRMNALEVNVSFFRNKEKFPLIFKKDKMGYGKLENPGDILKLEENFLFPGCSKDSGSKLYINFGILNTADFKKLQTYPDIVNEFISIKGGLINGGLFNVQNDPNAFANKYNPVILDL